MVTARLAASTLSNVALIKKGLRLTVALLCYQVSSLSNVALIKKGLRH